MSEAVGAIMLGPPGLPRPGRPSPATAVTPGERLRRRPQDGAVAPREAIAIAMVDPAFRMGLSERAGGEKGWEQKLQNMLAALVGSR